MLLIGPPETNFNEILIEIHKFSFYCIVTTDDLVLYMQGISSHSTDQKLTMPGGIASSSCWTNYWSAPDSKHHDAHVMWRSCHYDVRNNINNSHLKWFNGFCEWESISQGKFHMVDYIWIPCNQQGVVWWSFSVFSINFQGSKLLTNRIHHCFIWFDWW